MGKHTYFFDNSPRASLLIYMYNSTISCSARVQYIAVYNQGLEPIAQRENNTAACAIQLFPCSVLPTVLALGAVSPAFNAPRCDSPYITLPSAATIPLKL